MTLNSTVGTTTDLEGTTPPRPGDADSDADSLSTLIAITVFSVASVILLAIMWARKYRSLSHTIRGLHGENRLTRPRPFKPSANSHPTELVSVTLGQESRDISSAPALHGPTPRSTSRALWRPTGTGPTINKSGLALQQLIKAGRDGVYYKAKILRHTCKGHSVVTCKISKEGVPQKSIAREVNIMRKLGTHKNILQLLDWNITDTPCILIMESVNCGTLRSFLQVHQEELKKDVNLQCLFTMAAYNIAQAMHHLSTKNVVHCDLALRNIMVNHFPKEVKLTEFGLARDLSHTKNHYGSQRGGDMSKVPIRWYPPEYLRDKCYSFKGDVWSYGILLWEMETFSSLPYPTMDTPEEVFLSVCAGYRNEDPETCRPEICQIMKDCWLEDDSQRPSFSDIVTVLEDILETDADYVEVWNSTENKD